MQDRTLQRSYVKQAASRKNALNLREYPTPNRVNNINNKGAGVDNNINIRVDIHTCTLYMNVHYCTCTYIHVQCTGIPCSCTYIQVLAHSTSTTGVCMYKYIVQGTST